MNNSRLDANWNVNGYARTAVLPCSRNQTDFGGKGNAPVADGWRISAGRQRRPTMLTCRNNSPLVPVHKKPLGSWIASLDRTVGPPAPLHHVYRADWPPWFKWVDWISIRRAPQVGSTVRCQQKEKPLVAIPYLRLY